MNKKRVIALVVISTLIVLSFALSLSVSATSVDASNGWFNLDLTNANYLTGTNPNGTPYLRFTNVFSPYVSNPQSTTELLEVVLMAKYFEWNETDNSGSPLYYTYAPVTVSSYMKMPQIASNGHVIYSPSAVVLPTAEAEQAGVSSDVYDYNFGFDGVFRHCRFAISIWNDGKDLTMFYNPSFYPSAEAFLGAYNNQTDFGKLNENDTGIILIHVKNPALETNVGYQQGYSVGYSDGYNSGFDAGSGTSNSPIGLLFSGVNNILSIKLFGDVTLGLIVYSALGLGALFVVLKMFKH